jgi:heme-degrading monooxygenase HmoA
MGIYPGIASKNGDGYQGVQLFRRVDGAEVEFVVMTWFESLETVKKFAGEDYERAYVPPKAREILSRFDDRSQHYEVREKLDY